VIKLIFVCPKSIICHRIISLYEELKVRVVDFPLNHPLLNHREYWRGNFFYYPAYELFCLWATSKHKRIYSRANSTAS
jgi:hypothetical protein